jgi:hypothetical protein
LILPGEGAELSNLDRLLLDPLGKKRFRENF